MLSKLEFLLWVMLFAVTPQFIVPQAYESFLLPKIYSAETLIVALGGLALILTLRGRTFILPLNPVLLILELYAALHAISIFWALSPSLASDEAQWWLLLAAAGLLFPSAFARHERRQTILAATLLISGAITAIWVLNDDLRQAFWSSSVSVVNKLGDWRGVLHAGFGNTSHIGDFLALLFPLGFLLLLSGHTQRFRPLLLICLLLYAAGMVVVFSVHSTVSLLVALIFSAVLVWPFRARELSRWGIILLLACGAIVLFFSLDIPGNPHRPGIFKQAFASERLAFGWDSRLFIWLTGLDIAMAHRWLGVGSGNFTYVFPTTHSPVVLANEKLAYMAGSWTNAAHNELIQSWAEVGIAGPALLIMLFVLAWRSLGNGLRTATDNQVYKRIACIVALAAFAIQAQMNFPLQMAPACLMLLLLVGMAAIVPLEHPLYEPLPVRLDQRWSSVLVEIEGTIPRCLTFQLKPSIWLAAIAALLIALPAVALVGWHSARVIHSDMEYRLAHEANAQLQYGVNAAVRAAAEEHFRKALALWPHHHNCRSEYSEFLVREGRGEEALNQVDLTLQRLQAWELHLRRARALWEMDRADHVEKAREEVKKALLMRPMEAQLRPLLFAWATGKTQTPISPPPLGLPTENWR